MKFLKQYWGVIVVIIFGILASKGLIGSGYFNMHDDLQMMRQLELEKCFLTLQIPCRWIPDMGYGFGFPLFNFYPPLPYLFGEIFRLFGITFVNTVKLTFIFAFVASGVSMYFFSKQFFGKWGGIISSVFYIWAPYHAVDIYVRGAMNEAWALIFFPLILAISYRLIQEKQNKTKNIIFLALSWVGLLLSHNLMALIFAPIFAGWCLIWFLKNRNVKVILQLAVSGLLALGLAAFFTLPVTLEQNLVQTETLIQGYYDYSSHFATIKQLLTSRFWGYGPSVWEANDGMSFQVGTIHWIIASIITSIIAKAIIVKTIKHIKNKTKLQIENWMIVVIYFFIVGWVAVFMIHNKSTPLWLHVNALHFVQFPWRFLTLVILSFSFVIGAITNVLKNAKIKQVALLIFIGAVLIYSWDYFNVQGNKLGALTDEEKFTGAAWDLQRTAGIYDYLPKTAKTAPKAPMINFVEVIDGSAEVTNIKLGTNKNNFDINVTNDARIRLGVFDFPDWKVYVDDKNIETFIPESEEWGRIYFLIPKGEHKVRVELKNTKIRNISNIISLVSWGGLLTYLMLQFKRGGKRFTA